MQTLDPSGRHPIGPVTRVLAAAFLAALAALAATSALALLHAESLAPSTCGRKRLPGFCELGNLALSLTPRPLQGPIGAALNAAFVALLVWLVWWLLKPLLFKPRG